MPDPGFHAGLRELTRRAGTLLVIDETQTIPAGPRGCTGEWGLEPDVLTIGKCIGGGIPAGAYGMSEEVAAAMARYTRAPGLRINHAGFGGTLAAGELGLRAMRATLEHVMTPASYATMIEDATRFEAGVERAIGAHGLPWQVSRLGALVVYTFRPTPPRRAGEQPWEQGEDVREAIFLFLANRGVLIGCFGGNCLMSPATTAADVDRHSELFDALLAELA
jgi:glutamate-1-semialdehyde 2,1-aminomutase